MATSTAPRCRLPGADKRRLINGPSKPFVACNVVLPQDDAGSSIEEILEFLRIHSKTEVPQNVEISIKEWADRYGQIHFMDVMLLRCKSEQLAQELKASKQIGKYILGGISPTDLIVSRHKVDELRLLLEKRNYMPLPEVLTVEEE